MENVLVEIRSGGWGNSSVDVNLSDDAVEELFDEAFEGYCVVCRNDKADGDRMLCCACFTNELRVHATCCAGDIEDAAGA